MVSVPLRSPLPWAGTFPFLKDSVKPNSSRSSTNSCYNHCKSKEKAKEIKAEVAVLEPQLPARDANDPNKGTEVGTKALIIQNSP